KPMAVATSGSYRRGFTIENTLHSHIIDPRTGLPTSQIRSATVLAATAMDADALATSFSVLPVQQTIELTESIKNVECLLILANGRAVASSGWPGFRLAKHQLSNVDSMEPDTKTGLRISFSLNRPQEGRYRRPYVAIWLEDGDGFPVKTALLWLQVEQPGPRWHRDLTRWYRNDRARKLVESADLIKTVAGATRGPGKYETRFDGNDNSGKPLASGRYTLCIEVAREHGTYQIIRKSIMLGPKAIPLTKISGNVEVGGISYQYTPPSSKAN
ncbi:MAG: membrane-associated lipoprotein, partial [Planctomycetaceae bacterium]|nr:membrane-associated lipoprotein [Planctomycetaceae bacterium]